MDFSEFSELIVLNILKEIYFSNENAKYSIELAKEILKKTKKNNLHYTIA